MSQGLNGKCLFKLVLKDKQMCGCDSHPPVMEDDEGDGFKQDSVLCIGVLDFLGLWWLLGFIEDGFQALCETTPQGCVLCNNKIHLLFGARGFGLFLC